jgi:branched-chain amino acid transport system substrate-binding protein
MTKGRMGQGHGRGRRRGGAITLVIALALGSGAWGQTAAVKDIKIGVLFDFTGPFSAAGSLMNYRGAKLAIDWANERGGVLGKYKVVRVDADAQSKTDVAINEAERLLNAEKVDILAGIYSSAQAVPLAEKVDRQKRFLWITSAISDAVFKDRNLQYTFRAQAPGSSFGILAVQYIAAYSQDRLGKPARDLRVAVIHEDGPYGTTVAAFNESEIKKQGMVLVLKEGYSATTPDLSALVTKLRAARPDVLFHTGYNPDIVLFIRQAKEQGFRVKAYLGQGAGHSQLDKLKEAFGAEIEGFHTVDPIQADYVEASKLRPGVAAVTQDMVRLYRKEFGDAPPMHVSIGFNNMWILLNDVLPRAIQRHGGVTPDALAQAARETDIPDGGTLQAYGVKFFPPGHPMAGQNERGFPAVYQVLDGKFAIVFPKAYASAGPVLPLPARSALGAR